MVNCNVLQFSCRSILAKPRITGLHGFHSIHRFCSLNITSICKPGFHNSLTNDRRKYLHCRIGRSICTSSTRRSKDPYSVLGVSRNATTDEIKRKFRELAKKYHPDLNPSPDAKQKMAEISSAYELLSDPKKRQMYDQTGMNAGDGGYDPSDFAEMFSRMASGHNASNAFTGSTRGDDIQVFIVYVPFISCRPKSQSHLWRLLKDVRRTLLYQLGFHVESAKVLEGNQVLASMYAKYAMELLGVQRMERGPIIIGVPCRTCSGTGQVISHPCRACGGTGDRAQTKSVNLSLPAGVRQGMQMRVPNQGHVGPRGGKSGHLFVNINIQPHHLFKWIDDDIHVHVPITLKQCLLGGDVEVPTLEGTTTLSIGANSQPFSIKTLKNRGPPKLDSRNNGNLIVHLELKLPDVLTSRQREMVEEFDRESPSGGRMNSNPRDNHDLDDSKKWWKRVVGCNKN
ncbi:DnaJ 1 [Babesia gibsoni]|uniref:DnaJ 1 n=1 Tax=Babesia gibsoni TaxID=33632 RepID=A0AAD8PEM4_BABGI|nr:DnaJ 1 [Babesia gibsoni]